MNHCFAGLPRPKQVDDSCSTGLTMKLILPAATDLNFDPVLVELLLGCTGEMWFSPQGGHIVKYSSLKKHVQTTEGAALNQTHHSEDQKQSGKSSTVFHTEDHASNKPLIGKA